MGKRPRGVTNWVAPKDRPKTLAGYIQENTTPDDLDILILTHEWTAQDAGTAIDCAVGGGHLPQLQWLVDKFPHVVFRNDALAEGIIHRQRDTVGWYMDHYNNNIKRTNRKVACEINELLEGNDEDDIEYLEWITDRLRLTADDFGEWYTDPLFECTDNGTIRNLAWLVNKFDLDDDLEEGLCNICCDDGDEPFLEKYRAMFAEELARLRGERLVKAAGR